jgi:hypothetical protein
MSDWVEVAACLRLWMKGSTEATRSLYERSQRALESVEYDPNRGMPAECRELLTEVLAYVRQRPDLVTRIETAIRNDVAGCCTCSQVSWIGQEETA